MDAFNPLPALPNLNPQDYKELAKVAHEINQSKSQQHVEIDDNSQAHQRIEQILNLINNAFNFLSDTYYRELETQFKKYSYVLSQIKLPTLDASSMAYELPPLRNLKYEDLRDIANIAVTFNKN